MNKKIIVIAGLLLSMTAGFAQSTDEQPTGDAATTSVTANSLFGHYYRKYLTASRWGDNDVAIDALYDLITMNPADSLVSALGYTYFEQAQYASSALIFQDLVLQSPKNPDYLKVLALSYQSIGAIDRALRTYESLYMVTDDLSALYNMTNLQYQLGRMTECQANIDILLSDSAIDDLKVTFSEGQNNQQEYPIRVSLLNMKGMITESTDKEAAANFYREALSIAPGFSRAKENLDKLQK